MKKLIEIILLFILINCVQVKASEDYQVKDKIKRKNDAEKIIEGYKAYEADYNEDEHTFKGMPPKDIILYDKDRKLYTRKYIERYHNGQISFECEYENGKMEGVCKTYYENGQLTSSGIYKNGKKDGEFKVYYENGNIKVEELYKEGKPIAPAKWYDETKK